MIAPAVAGVLVDVECRQHPGLYSFTWAEACRRAHHRTRWFGKRYIAARCWSCGSFHIMVKGHA